MTPDELCLVLQKLFQPDTAVVAEATATLKAYFKQVEALENLLLLMSQNPDQQVRQISCVYLRKIIAKLWGNLTPDQQVTTKNLLIERFKVEPVTLVKKNIADVIGSLGRIVIPNKEWPELFAFIFSSTQSEQLADKELAMILLSVIIEYFTHEEIKTYYDKLNPIIEGYLQSNVPSLKKLSIETVNQLATTPKAIQVLKKYSNLIPLVLNALDLDQEDLIHKVFETFNEFVEIKKVLGPHLPMIIEKALLIASNKNFGVNLREVTLLFLELISEKYARVLIKKHGLNFVDKIIEEGFKIASEDPELYDQNEASPPSMAVQMLYSYACTVPNEKVYPIFKKHLQTFGVSKDQHERAAATTILGYIADPDSCLDLVRDDVNPLTNFLVDKMQDESYVVREAAGETVGRFSEHVVPDFLDKHKQIVPCLLRVIKDLYVSKHDMTIQKSLFALNEFVQNLDYDIKIYLEDIIKLLLEYINAQQFSRDVRYWALIALSSTIAAAGKKILPYMQVLLDALHNIITAQGQANTQQSCKGQALMCAGKLASSCGKDKFPTQAIEVFTAFGLECLKEDNKFELRETSISYFSDLTVLIKEEIAPVFDQVMTEILKTCMQEDKFEETFDKKKDPAAGGFSLDSDSEEPELMGIDVDVNTLDEKASAVNALGIIGCHAPVLCQTRFKEILEALENNQFYFHENIKYHVSLAYLQITVGLMRPHGLINTDEKYDWVKGGPSPLPDTVQEFLGTVVLPYYFRIFEQEEDKSVIERVLENMREMSEDLGPAVFEGKMERVMKYIIQFLEKKAFCQTRMMEGEKDEDLEDVEDENPEDDDESEPEEEDDGIDHDEIIFGNTSDLIIALARAMGNNFAPYFQTLAPHIVTYTSDKHPKSDRNMAMGCISEVFANCESVIPQYFNDYLPLLEKNSHTKDSKMNRNIAYNIGILAQHAPILFQPHLQAGLALLSRLHQNTSEIDAQDNIVAASCRIIEFQYMPLPPVQRPEDYAQMVDSIFQKIPFEGDMTENETILKFCFKLYEADQATCIKYMDNIARTAIKTIVDEKCADEMNYKFKKQVGEFINKVVMQHAQNVLQELEQQMSEHEKSELQKYLSA